MLPALLLIAMIPVVHLDRLPFGTAGQLDGKIVVALILVGKPPYTWKGVTVVGAADQRDEVERTAILPGNRLDLEGKRVVVVGKIRAIEHPIRSINGEIELSWLEIRIE